MQLTDSTTALYALNAQRRALLASLVLCLGLPLLASCGKPVKSTPVPRGATVLAFGDSVTFGTGAASGEDYPSQLAELTGWNVVNKGVPGETTSGSRSRIQAVLDEVRPALVIIEIGGNDFLRRHPENEIRDNLRAILATVRNAGIPVVLVSTPRFSLVGAAIGSLPDAELYAEIAKSEQVPLIPSVFADVLSDNNLKSDPIHPNAAGYRALADGIAKGLATAGFFSR